MKIKCLFCSNYLDSSSNCVNHVNNTSNHHNEYMAYYADDNWYIVFDKYVLQYCYRNLSYTGFILSAETNICIYIDLDPKAYLFSREKIMNDIIIPHLIFS